MQTKQTGKLRVEPEGETALRITRDFEAPRDLVFLAYTTPELVRRWLLGPPGWEMPVCEIDLRVGGRYRYVWSHADGRQMGMGGSFLAVVVPETIVNTELFDEDWTGGETQVTTRFVEQAGGTRTVQTVVYASPQAREGALFSGMADGMEAGYARLDALLAKAAAQPAAT